MKNPNVFPIAIIGRGIAGLCCAYRFSEAGFPVTIFGSSSVKACASKVATGMSTVKGNRFASQRLFQLKVLGHHQFGTLLQTVASDSHLDLLHKGVIEPFSSLLEYQRISAKVFRGQFRGIFGIQFLKASKERGDPSFFYPNDYFFDPHLVLNALESIVIRSKAEFIDQKINKLSPGQRQGEIAIHFADPKLPPAQFREVIVAAGHGSLDLLASSGVNVDSLCKVWGETALTCYDSNRLPPLGITKLGNSGVRINGLCRSGSSSLPSDRLSPELVSTSRQRLRVQHESFFGVASDSVKFNPGYRLRTRSREPLVGHVFLDPAENFRVRLATAFYKNGFQFADLAACFHVSHVADSKYNSDLFPRANQSLLSLT